MHKVILMLLLAVLSDSAMAEWSKVEETNSETAYVNIAKISKEGTKAEMWSLSDFKKPLSSGGYRYDILSMIMKWEYDCRKWQKRRLVVVQYSEHMGKGHSVYINSDPDILEPVKVNDFMFETACKVR